MMPKQPASYPVTVFTSRQFWMIFFHLPFWVSDSITGHQIWYGQSLERLFSSWLTCISLLVFLFHKCWGMSKIVSVFSLFHQNVLIYKPGFYEAEMYFSFIKALCCNSEMLFTTQARTQPAAWQPFYLCWEVKGIINSNWLMGVIRYLPWVSLWQHDVSPFCSFNATCCNVICEWSRRPLTI